MTMLHKKIDGWTRALGKEQGYFELTIRDIKIGENKDIPVMQSAWEPTPDELAMINAGAPIILSILGTGHPPVMLGVGQLPHEED